MKPFCSLLTLIVIMGMIMMISLLHVPAPALPQFWPLTPQQIKGDYQREADAKRLARETKVARQVFRRLGCRGEFAELTARNAIQYGIPTRVLAGLIFVESSCRPKVVSKAKCVGLTQVSPKTWKYTMAQLLNPETNVAIGSQILAGYVHRYGLKGGLHAYNGFGDPTDRYANSVLHAAGYST